MIKCPAKADLLCLGQATAGDLWCGGMAGDIWVDEVTMVALHTSLSPQHW